MSSRRARNAALEDLKRARQGGKRSYKACCNIQLLPSSFSSPRSQVEEDTDLYDEVTEAQYNSIVKGRLAKDDFVVDDGVEGYMDNGMDDFEEKEMRYESDEEDVKRAFYVAPTYKCCRTPSFSEEGQSRP